MRNFDEWLSNFKESISRYDYYVDFQKVYSNVEKIKIELNMLNSLVGSNNIENDFEQLIVKYPETLKCIPLLLAVRQYEIYCQDEKGALIYNFAADNQDMEQYKLFMEKTGLFDLLSNRIVCNLIDYVLGIETGLDSNARKNRGGKQMEKLVEQHLIATGLEKDETFFKEMTTEQIENNWNINFNEMFNKGKAGKRFDFVVVVRDIVFAIETNFYASGGSKLNETARSYMKLGEDAKHIQNFNFMWITDGLGWHSARRNLRETFEAIPHVYNINDLENGILEELFY